MTPRKDSRREPVLRGMLAAVLHRNPDATMVGLVRAFPMTWWATWLGILFAFALSAIYLLSGLDRFTSPAFDAARDIVQPGVGEPMRLWGMLFLMLAIAQVLAIRTSLNVLWLLLRGAATVYVFYAVLFGVSALRDDHASFGGLVLYTYVAAMHLACAQTIKLIHRGANR